MTLFPYHAGLMVISLSIIATGIVIVKTPSFKRRYFKYHRIAGIAGTICSLMGLIAAVVMVSINTGEHINVLHAYTGAVAILGMICTVLLGLLQFRWKAKVKKMMAVHRWSGRATTLILIAALITGLLQAGIL
jgi:hypothetical protein